MYLRTCSKPTGFWNKLKRLIRLIRQPGWLSWTLVHMRLLRGADPCGVRPPLGSDPPESGLFGVRSPWGQASSWGQALRGVRPSGVRPVWIQIPLGSGLLLGSDLPWDQVSPWGQASFGVRPSGVRPPHGVRPPLGVRPSGVRPVWSQIPLGSGPFGGQASFWGQTFSFT
jgi:hypothetical protein